MAKNISSTSQLFHYIGMLAEKMNTEVYVVGGYVRDKYLGRDVKDIDFTVINDGIGFARALANALGMNNIVCFEKFGTCIIPYKDYKLEFVQARSEKYEPGSRKPIVSVGDLHTDLERRDFTINTLARKLTREGPGKMVDLFNGREDLKNKIIRTPLDPLVTFDDDPLRMIRAVRFVVCLRFTIDSDTLQAIKEKRDRIKIVSQERVTDEFVKILQADIPSIGLDLLRKTGLLEIIFPELYQLIGVDQRGTYHHKDVWFHTLKVVDNVAAVSRKFELRLAALYHDVAKPQTKRFEEKSGWTFHSHEVLGAKMIPSIIRRLKLPVKYIPYLQKLINLHLRPINLSGELVTDSAIRRLIVGAGEDLEDLLKLCRADITSGNPARVKMHLKNFGFVEKRIQEVEEIDAFRAFKSPVDGNEIMEVCGINPSPLVGKLKSMIEEAILDGNIPNEHDAAFEYLLHIKNKILQKEINNQS
ncbi:tRNA nucleotidyltransferase [bacterium SM23_31]|nr:MAG: tRNA nucleotidyltransferase [bacterium SM23_31]